MSTHPIPEMLSSSLSYATSVDWSFPAAFAATLTGVYAARASGSWPTFITARKSCPPHLSHLAERLEHARRLKTTKRHHELKSRRAAADHAIALAAVDTDIADDRERQRLSALYRKASVSGTRARIKAQINESAEARGLRVAAVHHWTLRLGIAIMCVFGVWSTAGVHAGVATLLALASGSVGWWAAWLVEPALTTVVAMIIVVRSVLRTSGGDTDARATRIMWGALSISVVLNAAGDWPGEFSAAAVGALVAHSIGPVGAAGTAHLISVIDDYVACARPWDDAPRVEEMQLDQAANRVGAVATAKAEDLSGAESSASEEHGEDLPGWEPWVDPDPEGDEFWEAVTRDTGTSVESTPALWNDPFDRAVAECRFAIVTTGRPLSERKLAAMYRKPDGTPMGRRWARRVRERAALEDTGALVRERPDGSG
ncbi:hypothetical protein [Nocardiopsis rhodophaea]|uniref:hypothetical protein n=1 Tax=Nocardiopsis rhodophaea TaxID=280238 RepID=UPI0031D024C0